ncbi:hypothetical protein PR202_ga22137 [Eleusine coracana subsp. coracana]|uniref:DUF4220 domain-containing protein n=1 Tax=Eleusine coracana subsp. coracana TaxID=191504 RepID=A0AAV5D2V0_ELECO|nr:hypothetical protein PR202_ga22137 [Eleusine coracana subsp. coracana]
MVGLWEECQLQVLALASHFLQYFVFNVFLIWLAYLACDALAIYALATLFNRHKKQKWLSMSHNSVNLQVLCAPILLLHLGGQDSITTYNIEDNELWRRHVLTAVSQKTVAHDLLRSSLSKAFDRLYTKYQVYKGLNICDESLRSYCGGWLRSVVIYLMFAAIGLFHKGNREVYNGTDIKITYILLCCTAALEYTSIGIKPCFDCCQRLKNRLPWPDRVAQYNLIGYLSPNKKHRRLRRPAFLLVCKDYLDQLWCMNPCKSSEDITSAHTRPHYRRLDSLNRDCSTAVLELSVQRPFNESVLLWHLATDFCFHHGAGTSPTNEIARRSREISNYMAYLLFVNPEMLVTGARRSLFRNSYKDLKKIVVVVTIQSSDGAEPTQSGTAMGEENLAKMILQKVEREKGSGLVDDAWELAQELMKLDKEENEDGTKKQMWTVIQGVWVEMLCFSASRCRGYLDAKSLGKGGEYLSYVWLLLSYMGMETLAGRMQRTDLHEPGDKGSAGLTSASTATIAGEGNV